MFVRYQTMLTIIFFNDTATTEIYTLSLHDALPISSSSSRGSMPSRRTIPLASPCSARTSGPVTRVKARMRSEEHTSELQCQYLVCRLLLEKLTNYHAHTVKRVTAFLPRFHL